MKIINKIFLSAITFSSLLNFSASASVATNLGVTGEVTDGCLLNLNAVTFSNYDLSQIDEQSTMDVTCTNTTNYVIKMGSTSDLSGALAAGSRYMTRAGDTETKLLFGIYSDSARTIPWGDDGTFGANVAGTGTGLTQVYTIYFRIPANQGVVAGENYTETVRVSIDFV